MFRRNQNSRSLATILAIISSLAIVAVADNDWPLQGKLKAVEPSRYDYFGCSVSISGATKAIRFPGFKSRMA